MKIIKEGKKIIDLFNINPGDIIETTRDTYMIIRDDDGMDFRALSLTTLTPSCMESTVYDLIDCDKILGDVVEVYKNENIEIKLNRR